MCETRQAAQQCGCSCLRLAARQATRRAQWFLGFCAFCVIATYGMDILKAILYAEIAVFAGLAAFAGFRVVRAWRRWQLARVAIPVPAPAPYRVVSVEQLAIAPAAQVPVSVPGRARQRA